MTTELVDAIEGLIEDYQDYNSSFVKVYNNFNNLDKLVKNNRPAIFKSVANDWEATKSWNKEYLSHKVTSEIEIAVTPNGNADALVEHHGVLHFLEPDTKSMRMDNFLNDISATPNRVLYLQSQNGNLSYPEYQGLAEDVPQSITEMDDVMENKPDAVNIWIGGPESVTSLHSDPYENIYVVVKGSKTFNLYPPTERYCLNCKKCKYPHGHYICDNNGEFTVKPSGETISWTPIDPNKSAEENSKHSPTYSKSRCLTVTVDEGDALYLPSGWFHHVSQKGSPCIAVNYWYDQDYSGEKFVMRQFYNRILEMLYNK
ncbi:Clavaminate synthase-like protein [Wallemia mellicola]|uniref:Clavaminate synthase-like protein n=1 Tax=Wallemia mellicola TaxID=1708541 RepID=A0AB38MLA9_9BASI|nr:hypothetical protein E3Q24_01484 [Wallemia mellicola]TIB86881.1 Clavaminate synthase-like protein [Wallemia mellicola]TIB89819.1 Clavaminate synthase-like protein [Wallemia mellicola]TIC06185.1 Clavaminate synthase-like protein [Wallemia mellicola]TIC24436.1 Clavaminate synthase-like protein [Wallemia mellicola]